MVHLSTHYHGGAAADVGVLRGGGSGSFLVVGGNV